VRTNKRCPKCGEIKPLEAFPKSKSSPIGVGSYCKPCHNARNRELKQRLYGGGRHHHLLNRYGVGAEAVEEMIQKQGGVCLICLKNPATQVDHSHSTGEVRGVLCDGCNGGLGAFNEDLDLLEEAARYLEEWRDK
jgi:hypothetical protein